MSYYNFLFEDNDSGEYFFVALRIHDFHTFDEALDEAKKIAEENCDSFIYLDCCDDDEADELGYDTL